MLVIVMDKVKFLIENVLNVKMILIGAEDKSLEN